MNKYLKVFLTCFLIFAVGILIVIIPTGGIWVYYGDFNVQQIPFYIHLHDAIRSGNIFYDWTTDLGGSLVGCYSFYILGSPFFWLTIPFPSDMVAYLIPWINCLKYAVMGLTAFIYLSRHLRTEAAAFWGALLYAFSGYAGAVLVYNHFHDVMAFFPLYLLFFEQAMEEKKRVRFALMTALMLIINYFFFVGEVVFLVIFFFTRYFDIRRIKDSIVLALRAFICGLAGVLTASAYFLPAIYYTTVNSRLSSVLYGNDLLAYKESTMLLGILKNTVMLSDISGLNSMFNQSFSRVSGVAAYLPLVSISCVLTFFYINNKKNWARKTIATCLVFACVPVLNALFVAMNSEYYARWFFMPILIMAYMSASVLENLDEDTLLKLRKAVFITTGLTVFIWLAALLPAKKDDKWTILGNIKNSELLVTEIIFSAAMLVLLMLLVLYVIPKLFGVWGKRNNTADRVFDTEGETCKEVSTGEENVAESETSDIKRRRYEHVISFFIVVGCLCTCLTMILSGDILIEPERKTAFIEQGIKGGSDISLPDVRFYRIETEENVYNYPMIWSMPSITSFISTIPGSTIDFYNAMGLGRKVTSDIPESKIGIRTLLSAKYYLVEGADSIAIETIGYIENVDKLKGYSYMDSQNGFDIYKNDHFVPMGFYFDNFITQENFENNEASATALDKLVLYALILDDETAQKYGSCMKEVTAEEIPSFTYPDVQRLADNLRSHAGNSFKWDTNGFTSEMDMAVDNLVFYSVPYEDGFTAYVDGIETDIIKVDYGFMAVFVPEGYHKIEFKFTPEYLGTGIKLSLMGAVLVLILVIAGLVSSSKKKSPEYTKVEQSGETI